MAKRGNPAIYLFVVAMVAGMVSACAPSIRESKAPLADYVNLSVGEWLDETHPSVRIVDIQRVGESRTRYIPSLSTHDLWLRPGKYEATFECLRPQMDAYTTSILKLASPADADGHVRFTIEFHAEFEENPYMKNPHPYEIDCAISADGKPEFVVEPVDWVS